MTSEKRWHTHYPNDIPKTMTYLQQPLHSFLTEIASLHPNKRALHFMGYEMTFSEVHDQVRQLAAYLQSLGLNKGDRVAIMLPNSPQALISYYAVLFAGGIVVQTNPLYTERELEYQLNDSGAIYIVCLDILLPRVTNIRNKTSIQHIIIASIKDYLPFPKNIIYPFIQKREYNIVVKLEQTETNHVWKNVMSFHGEPLREIEINPREDLALLQYTGGTTGRPKGVMLTHYNLVANVQMCEAWLYKCDKNTEIVLGILPFFHVYGMTTVMNLAVMRGSKIILMPKFEPKSLLKMIHKQKPTLFPGAPTIYVALLNHPDLQKYDLSSIEACISGSAPLPLEVQDQFEKVTGGRLVEGYGLTESSPVTHANFLWEKRINGSIGVPWPNTEAKIVHMETAEELPVGEKGEIAVKGPQVMKGYWNNQEATDEVLKDGWLYTGDVGYMDDEGYFYIIDRKGDMVIAGGYNIYPREIEEVLYEHEGVKEAAVAGVPDQYRGETVKAFIVRKDGYDHISEGELDTFCRQHLAAYKVPKRYEFRDDLPKSTIGKILKTKLIQEETDAVEINNER